MTDVLVVVLLVLVLFLVIRSFWLWYWKINKIVDLLTEIRNLLARNTK